MLGFYLKLLWHHAEGTTQRESWYVLQNKERNNYFYTQISNNSHVQQNIVFNLGGTKRIVQIAVLETKPDTDCILKQHLRMRCGTSYSGLKAWRFPGSIQI